MEPGDNRVPGTVGEVDEKASARCVVGRECETEEAPFATGSDGTTQVEKVGGGDRTVRHDADPAGLFDDKLDGGVGRILDERHW